MEYKGHVIGKPDVVLEAFELSTIHASATLLHESTKKVYSWSSSENYTQVYVYFDIYSLFIRLFVWYNTNEFHCELSTV